MRAGIKENSNRLLGFSSRLEHVPPSRGQVRSLHDVESIPIRSQPDS